jgi:hypothetical protein
MLSVLLLIDSKHAETWIIEIVAQMNHPPAWYSNNFSIKINNPTIVASSKQEMKYSPRWLQENDSISTFKPEEPTQEPSEFDIFTSSPTPVPSPSLIDDFEGKTTSPTPILSERMTPSPTEQDNDTGSESDNEEPSESSTTTEPSLEEQPDDVENEYRPTLPPRQSSDVDTTTEKSGPSSDDHWISSRCGNRHRGHSGLHIFGWNEEKNKQH